MNEPSNTPLYETPPPTPPLNDMPMGEPEPFYKIWLKALTRPTEQTYIEIANSPSASQKTAFMWLGISYIIAFVVTVAITQLATMIQYGGDFSSGIGSALTAIACGAPIAAAVALLIYTLEIAIVQWVAKMFKGVGSFDKLLYAFAAFTAPLSLVSAAFSIFSIIPFVGFCTSIIGIAVLIYSLFLMVTATKAVNGFGWGEAAGSVLIPTLVFIFLCSCLTIGILMVLGPVIGDVFSTINTSLGQ